MTKRIAAREQVKHVVPLVDGDALQSPANAQYYLAKGCEMRGVAMGADER